MKKINWVILIGFGAVFNIMAAENTSDASAPLREKVNNAIIKFEKTEPALWSYNISRYENEEGDISSSIEQYSPTKTQQWLLKEINGQPPTEKQINNFSKKKKKQSKKIKQGENIQLKLRELINEESLSLLFDDENHIVMAFNVNLKKLGESSVGKLKGKLVYQKNEKFIEKISIWNSAEFSPMFTANITDLAITFTFLHINGAVLSQKNEMKMKGSFAYFTEINETSLDTFSDYLYQGK